MRLRRPWGSALSGPALWAAAKARVAQWDRRARDPAKAQLDTLLSHCRTAQDTAFGRAHRLGSVTDHAQFAARVPTRSYAEVAPWLQRMRAGEPDVLWPGRVPYFALSSGTSGTAEQKKHLPISREQIRWQQRAGFDCVARYVAMADDRGFGGGYTLCLWPPGTVEQEGAVRVGSNPGVMSLHLPWLARRHALPDPRIRDLEDCEAKLDRLGDAYLGHDVRSLSGTTCWFSLVFDRVLAATGARSVSEVWPGLKVLFGGGVPSAPYRAGIERRVGRAVAFIDNYNATEGGIFAATDQAGDDGLLVLPDRGVFFEFVPRADVGTPGARRVPLWQVETGVDYAVVVTTASGLFAYELGDCVRFTHLAPHRLVFAGRLRGMLSLTQELTTQRELERAVGRALAEARHVSDAFAAATELPADGASRGRYVVLMELDRRPHDLAGLEALVDRGLCDENRVYRAHRAGDVAILPPRVVCLPSGTFRHVLGLSNVQQKIPRILTAVQRDRLLEHGLP